MTATPGLLDRSRAFQAQRAVRETAAGWADRDVAGGRSVGRARERAARLAELLDGAVDEHPDGLVVRVESPELAVPLDRAALATLPFSIDPKRPFVCLDTETTGLATGAGTVVFLVGLGRWDGQRFRVTQLFLPDHADEPAFLGILAAELPPDPACRPRAGAASRVASAWSSGSTICPAPSSPSATSPSCATGSRATCARSPSTTSRTCAPWRASWVTWARSWPIQTVVRWPTRGTSAGWPELTRGSAATRKPSPASTPPGRPSPRAPCPTVPCTWTCSGNAPGWPQSGRAC